MTALNAAHQCASCRKPLRLGEVHKVGLKSAGKPEQIFYLCLRCAMRVAQGTVRLERAQGLRGVLQA